MIDITSILKSDSLIMICIGIILVSGLIVIVYKSNKNSLKRLQRQNTKELNDTLTMEIIEEQNSPIVVVPEEAKKEETVVPIVKETISEPVTIIDDNNLQKDIVEALAKEQEEIEILEQKPEVVNNITEEVKLPEVEPIKVEETIPKIEVEQIEKPAQYEINEEENLVYAPIELNQQEAREALEKLQIELAEKEEQEEYSKEIDEKNIELTNFEREQEENAIISLDELMKRGSEIYNNNEQIGYEDEGNEPITIEQLQERWQQEKEKIEQIEIEEKVEAIKQQEENNVVVENTAVEIKEEKEEIKKEVKKVEFPSILPNRKEVYESKFENSPIISPIYGIERKKFEEQERLHPELVQNNDLTLENTANYEKFDEEIKKTNEFIEALKELQKKLD